jgi:cation transporter-like permease
MQRYWHHLYLRRRRRILGINAKQMATSQVFSLIGSIIAGVLLDANKETLVLIVGAFVVLPGIFDLNGSLGATLSAKINHQLEKVSEKSFRVFFRNLAYILAISMAAGLLVASVGAGISTVFFDADFSQVFTLAETSIVLSALIGFPVIGLLSLLFRRYRVNPDDVVGPIESSIFDILTIASMVVVIGWLV